MKISYKCKFVTLLTFCFFTTFFYLNSVSIASNIADVPLTEATPESQGLDSTKLEKAVVKINKGDYGSIHSLLIIRNNYLVLEKYFSKYNRDLKHPVYSVTKSITSALVGIAIEQGKISNLQNKVLGFFPEYKGLDNVDQRKNSNTIENLLTMTAGFQWDELSMPYTIPLNDIRKLVMSPDPIKYMLDLPMRESPGSFEYNSGCTLLIGGVLNNACDQSVNLFAEDNLFIPLGILETKMFSIYLYCEVL